MKIVVLAGGLSHEREVSLTSGSLITNALIERGHSVCCLDLYTGFGMNKSGFGCFPKFTTDKVAEYRVSQSVPDLDKLKLESGRGELRIGEGVLDICRKADVVFIALHGDVGENGRLQALLDMEGITYTGSGYIGSMLAMDKDISKRLLKCAGIPTPEWMVCELFDKECDKDIDAVCHRIMTEIGLPCVIKPCSEGSSVGISIPETESELKEALAFAAGYERRIIAEKKVNGRELAVGIIGDTVLPAVEIVPLNGFYDYENKYQAGRTREICPTAISNDEKERLERNILEAFHALRLDGYARFDCIEDTEGVFWFLEANTLPGMTPTSLLPLAASVLGIGYAELCERMILMSKSQE